MNILKVTAFFHHVTPAGVRWDFHEGETLGPDDLALRGLGAEEVERWMQRGHLADAGAAVPEAAPVAFGHIEAMMAQHAGLAGGAGDAAMVKESGADAPEEE